MKKGRLLEIRNSECENNYKVLFTYVKLSQIKFKY